MKRDLAALSAQEFDVLVVGAGIYGACAAWDAALRGFSVALIDKGDFGHATSANSLKILHGGLRYLQTADLSRMRESIRERRTWMRIAPHLVRPQPFLMPTVGHLFRGRQALSLALSLTDLIGFDRNRGVDPAKHIPAGRIIDRKECLRLLPGLPSDGITGGALWYDGIALNTERLVFSVVLSAAQSGAAVANYVEAEKILTSRQRVIGVKARDRLTGSVFEIRARMILNASGPWINQLRPPLSTRGRKGIVFAKAMNLVAGPVEPTVAFAVPERSSSGARSGGRFFFFVPWRNRSLIGTAYFPYAGHPNDLVIRDDEVDRFRDDLRRAYPAAALEQNNVLLIHVGLVPVDGEFAPDGRPRLATRSILVDHGREEGLEGLISITGGKFTTARSAAASAIDLVCEKLGSLRSSATSATPLVGGAIESFDDFVARETAETPSGLSAESVRRLIFQYGSAYREVASFLSGHSDGKEWIDESNPVLRAEVLWAVREEMAETLADVVFRRTDLGSAGHPGESVLEAAARIVAAERGWNPARTTRELEEVQRSFPVLGKAISRPWVAAGGPQ